MKKVNTPIEEKVFIVAVKYGDAHWAVEHWSINQVLNEVNRDHSAEWIDYGQTDWREGWDEWVDPEYTVMIEVI